MNRDEAIKLAQRIAAGVSVEGQQIQLYGESSQVLARWVIDNVQPESSELPKLSRVCHWLRDVEFVITSLDNSRRVDGTQAELAERASHTWASVYAVRLWFKESLKNLCSGEP